ncbi:MAG: cation transporter [Candidatus Woesearchaeota archaeon]
MKKKEQFALIVGAIGSLLMAFIAWITYYYSNSEAILLDGNYSFIMFIGILIALKLASIRAIKTKTFPLGQFFYESLYGFIKGLMIFGVILMAVMTAIVRIFSYYFGSTDNIPQLIPEPIIYYAITVGIICFILSYNYKIQNKKISDSSIILKTEQKASFVDGVLSFGIAIGVIMVLTFSGDETGSFIPYLADSIFVLVLASFLIKEPIKIIKESVIELASGTLQNENTKKMFENVIQKHKSKNYKIKNSILSKNGSKYIIILYVESKDETYNIKDLKNMKKNIEKDLTKNYEYVFVDIIPFIK